ncbi:MAG: alanine dehydrogenase, partial [Actinomycetota bacterium]
MNVGIPKEVKDNEARVAATPEGVRELAHAGHLVVVETTAGVGSSISDQDFEAAGATILPSAEAVFESAEMIVKVKEPQPQEYERFRTGQILFTFLHLAADAGLTSFLLERDVTSLAYETVRSADGRLPLLAPMSEIAGRMAPHVGANHLERPKGGRGVLMGGAAGVAPAKVVVLGAGMAGSNAAWIAAGMEAEVVVVDRDIARLRWIDQQWRGRIQTVASSHLAVERLVVGADIVVGAVLVPGAKAPHLVSAEMVGHMQPGAVLVDISIDQGGCFETAHMTTHSEPTYLVDDVVHYCVGNMPGAVPRTST